MGKNSKAKEELAKGTEGQKSDQSAAQKYQCSWKEVPRNVLVAIDGEVGRLVVHIHRGHVSNFLLRTLGRDYSFEQAMPWSE